MDYFVICVSFRLADRDCRVELESGRGDQVSWSTRRRHMPDAEMWKRRSREARVLRANGACVEVRPGVVRNVDTVLVQCACILCTCCTLITPSSDATGSNKASRRKGWFKPAICWKTVLPGLSSCTQRITVRNGSSRRNISHSSAVAIVKRVDRSLVFEVLNGDVNATGEQAGISKWRQGLCDAASDRVCSEVLRRRGCIEA